MEAEQHTAEEILRALRFGVDYTFTVKVRHLEVVVRPLSITERVKVVNDVSSDISKLPPEQRTGLTESSLLAIRMIELATTPEPDSRQAPMLPAALLERFTSDELAAMHKAYMDGLALLDPSLETLPKAQLDELVEAAKKKALDLKELPRPHLESITQHLATLVASLSDNTPGG